MHYSGLIHFDIANGPGIRTSLFVSGCRNACPGCFNQEAQSFTYGREFDSKKFDELLGLLENEQIAGLSILGGEPLEPENRAVVTDICRRVKAEFGDSKTIWLWTGYDFKAVMHLPIMKHIDILVDGPFIKSLKDLSLAYRGSSNQCIIDVRKSLEAQKPILWENE